MPDAREYREGEPEDDGQSTLISTPSNTEHLKILLLHGEEYEVKVIELGPNNGPLACTICVRVPDDYLVDAGPADIVDPQCAQAIRRALDVWEGKTEKRQALPQRIADTMGLPLADIFELFGDLLEVEQPESTLGPPMEAVGVE